MSTELLGLVWPLKLPASQKVVLLAIADRVSRDQRGAFPSIATLADDSCLAERTVRQALRGLEAAGLIATRLRTGTSSYYVPNVDRLEDLQAERLEARRLLRVSAQTSNEGGHELPGGGGRSCRGGRHHMPGGAAAPAP